MNTATHSASSAATPMETAPGPSIICTTVPTPIPRVTPIIIWTARCARSTLLIDRRHGGGDRREERLRVVQHVAREEPGQTRGH